MSRNSQEIADEVLRRVRMLDKQDAARAARKRKRIHSVIAVAACLVLVVGLAFAIPIIVTDSPPTEAEAEGIYNAAMLADAAVGGYVLVGVIGFASGVAVTIFCTKGLSKKTAEEPPRDGND